MLCTFIIQVINYFGHGGENGLSSERIVTVDDILSWQNTDKYNLFVTVTCEFTRFDNPALLSPGEYSLRKEDAGSVAMVTTTRSIFVSTGTAFNHLLAPYLFNYNNEDDNQEKQRDNGYYLNELIHSYIKIYKSVNDIVHENNNINFAALKYHNDSNNKLSSTQYGSIGTTDKTNNYLSQLNNKENPKFLIALPDYKNRVDIPETYTFDIMDNLLSRFNVLSMIYFDTDIKGQIFQLFINYIIFFTVNTKFSPIRELPNITSS